MWPSRARCLGVVASALRVGLEPERAAEAELLGAELTVGQRRRCATHSAIGGMQDCCYAPAYGLVVGSNRPWPRFVGAHEAGEMCPTVCPELGNSDLNQLHEAALSCP